MSLSQQFFEFRAIQTKLLGICSGLALRTKLLFHFAFKIRKLLAKVQVNVVRGISSDIQIPTSGLKTVARSNFF